MNTSQRRVVSPIEQSDDGNKILASVVHDYRQIVVFSVASKIRRILYFGEVLPDGEIRILMDEEVPIEVRQRLFWAYVYNS